VSHDWRNTTVFIFLNRRADRKRETERRTDGEEAWRGTSEDGSEREARERERVSESE
jgi:hypothetical protein